MSGLVGSDHVVIFLLLVVFLRIMDIIPLEPFVTRNDVTDDQILGERVENLNFFLPDLIDVYQLLVDLLQIEFVLLDFYVDGNHDAEDLLKELDTWNLKGHIQHFLDVF